MLYSDSHNQRGFAALEAILIVILVCIIGFTGWYVWHSQKSANKTFNNIDQSTSVTGAKKSSTINKAPASQSTSKYTPQEAIDSTQKFYDSYRVLINKLGSNAAYVGVQPYLTSDLLAKVTKTKGADGILCSQEQLSKSTVTLSSSNDSTVNMNVATYNLDGAFDGTIKASARLSDLLLTSISCP